MAQAPVNSPFLTARQRRTVEALAEVYIAGEDVILTPKEITDNIDRHLRRVRSSRTRSLRLILFVIEHLIPRLVFPPSIRSFSRMSLRARHRLVKRVFMNPGRMGVWRDLAKIRTFFGLGYYSDERVRQQIGFVPVEERPKYQPDKLHGLDLPPLRLADPSPPRMQCEVCVIGSGAAGAVVACEAAAMGRDVILLEEGPHVASASTSHDENEMTALLYKESGVQTTVDFDLVILQGQCLGGSTVINNAICFDIETEKLEAPGGPLDQWAALGAHIDRARLAQSFRNVSTRIGVGPLLDRQEEGLPAIDGQNSEVFRRGWDHLVSNHPELSRFPSGLLEKNYERCLGCGHCNFGCPYERKRSMLETYIPDAIDHGARVLVDCHAVGIERNGKRARGVRCELADGRTLFIEAEKVVVSCGAIGSSVQLLKSGIRRNVGRRFSFNAATLVFAQFVDDVNGWDGVQMARYVKTPDFLMETAFNPPTTFSMALPGNFDVHFERMTRYNRMACSGVLIGTGNNGRVKRWPFFRRTFGPVKYRMTRTDLDRLRDGMILLTKTYFAAGAEVVFPATFIDAPLERRQYAGDSDAIAAHLGKHVQRPEDLTLSSAHPQGGNAMSDNPRIGVVDSRFRVLGYENLFVCDASVFPTTVGINPQLTIMATADYFARLGDL